jgi:hypothetical protein
LGLQGKNFISLKYWLVDYGASNHIISFVDTIHNIWSYSGSLQITLANGRQLPIHDVGDNNSYVRDVFVSLELFTGFILYQ